MPYVTQGDQWVGFDDVDSFRAKVRPSPAGRGVLGAGGPVTPPRASSRRSLLKNIRVSLPSERQAWCPDLLWIEKRYNRALGRTSLC